MEDVIKLALTGDAQKNALEFAAFMRANEISCIRETQGYWADKIYFACNYKGHSVCYISINEYEDNTWYVTGDDSGDGWYADPPLDEQTRKIAWKHIDICTDYGACGACGSPEVATRKKIFGKEFDRVCPVTLKFTNPDADAVECMKKVFAVRTSGILGQG